MKKVIDILNTKYPLIQGPMSYNTDAKLVSAVSNAGGLGVLGPNAGQSVPSKNIDDAIDKMKEEIIKTKMLTTNPFAINLISSGDEHDNENEFLEKLLELSLSLGIKYFVVIGTIGENLFKKIKDNNAKIIFRPTTPTIEIFKKAEKLGVDILVATGHDEGGILPENSLSTFSIVPILSKSVDIPVLAAGAINDSNGVKASFALGADGVYIGTRFLVTTEAPTSLNTKKLIINSTIDDLININGISNSISTSKAIEIKSNLDQGIDQFPIILDSFRNAMLLGNTDEGIISVNSSIDLITEILDVKVLIEKLFDNVS